MAKQTVLIIGANRGLGLALTELYAKSSHVVATTRSEPKEGTFSENVQVVSGVDLSKPDVGQKLVAGLKGTKLDVVIIVAGLLKPETFDEPKWEDEVQMYTICAIAPVFITHHLAKGGAFNDHAKLVLLTSEGGSIGLRTEEEGGGMYGHHGSKAAGNMVGKLLSYDLKKKGVAVAMIHPGFLKTDMTKGAGFEEFYDQGGAIEPEESAPHIAEFILHLTLQDSGKFQAPLGAKGIGNAEAVMGKEVLDHKGPLELPW